MGMENKLRVPFVVAKHAKEKAEIKSSKVKFLVPKAFKVSHFLQIITKDMELAKDTAAYLFISDTLLKQDQVVGDVYEKYKDQDGFCYGHFALTPSFGNLGGYTDENGDLVID